MKNILKIITFISIFLTGCAGLPKNSNDTGVLFIPIERDYKAGDAPYVKYRIEYTNGNGNRVFYITLTKDFSIIKNLTPGKYTVEKVQPVYIKSGKRFSSMWSRLDPFEIKPGQITISPKKLYVSFRNFPDGTRRQSGEFVTVYSDDLVKIHSNLNNLKGIEDWKVGKI